MRISRGGGRGLVDELQGSHRLTLGVLAGVLVVSVLTSTYLLLVSQPRLTSYIELTRAARETHAAMLDQETGLRGWLATGDEQFLEPYADGKAAAAASIDEFTRDMRRRPEVIGPTLETLLARQDWQQWADRVESTRLSGRQHTDGTLTRTLLEGKVLFDRYRAADTRSMNLIRDHRDEALREQRQTLIGVLAIYVAGVAGLGAVSMRRRQRLNRTLLAPIDDLHDTIGRLRDGDLSARAPLTTVPELAEVGTELGRLADRLAWTGAETAAREAQLTLAAERFEMLVRLGREISGSLSIRYVSAAVTRAATELVAAPTTLWIRDGDAFRASSRSDETRVGPDPTADPPVSDVVARAAADAALVAGEGRCAYPLVLAGRVTGVLEVDRRALPHGTEPVLASLLSTAAVALESAHLHSTAREQADHDALTALPNRRRFEVDVDLEWSRCRRYGRPLSVVMLDLDHFKRLNDEHGHQVGDQALRAAATAMTGALRDDDTAYRYGGEEFVVLLREAGLEDAQRAAERMRQAVAGVVLPGLPQVTLTTSVGVATRRADMSHYTALVAVADQALYEAKRLGRDRVVTGLAEATEPLGIPASA